MVGFYRLIKTANPSSKQPFAFSISRALIIMGAMLFCIFTATYASAANTRIELSSVKKRAFLAPYIQKIDNPNNIVSYEWAQKEFNKLSPDARAKNNVLAFGAAPAPVWLNISVTNATEQDKWHFDLGALLEGRLGAISSLKIVNATTHTTIIDWHTNLPRPLAKSIPLTLSPNKTEDLYIAMTFNGFLPAQIVPSLIAEDNINTPNLAKITATIIAMLLLIATGFFLPFSLIKNQWTYISYALYMFGNAGLIFYLSQLQWQTFLFQEHIALLFLSTSTLGLALIIAIASRKNFTQALCATSIIVIGTLFTFLPASIETMQLSLYALTLLAALGISLIKFTTTPSDKIIKKAKPFYNATYAIALTCLTLSFATYASPYFNAVWASNLFIFSLIPQMALLFIAVRLHFLGNQKIEQEQEIKQSRANHALARLQQSKDAADQARLLRVIERERELMGDLREKESQRAEEMRKAKDEADEANAAKSVFLAVVSHEIRTPMNGIMGILKLMQDTNPSKEQSDFLLTMQKTGETMVALLNDILDFEKIENGSMDLEHITIDIQTMTKGIITLMTGYIKGKNVKLISDISPDIPRFVMGDPTRLQQVLFNLVSNALKFTEDGNVTIKLEKGDDDINPADLKEDQCAVKFSITDTGIGISEEGQQKLFQPFKQAESSTARKYGGTGLGLAICMRLIEAMGSKIKVHSTVGKGTTFHFTLIMDVGYNAETDSLDTQSSTPSETPEQAVTPLDIVIIEDNDINRKVLQSLMEKDNHRVTPYPSAEEALENLPHLYPDIIFTDINLLGMNGLEFTKKIRIADNMPHLQNLKIIGLTGNVRPEDLEEMKQAGLNGALTKPIDYDLVKDILSKVTPSEKPATPSPDLSATDLQKTDPLQQTAQPTTQENTSAPSEMPPYTPAPPQEDLPEISTPETHHTTLSDTNTSPSVPSSLSSAQQPLSPLQELAQETPMTPINEPTASITMPENEETNTAASQDSVPEKETPTNTENTTSNDLPPENYDMTMLNSLMDSLGKDTFIELVDGCLDQVDIIVAAMQEGDKQGDADYIRARMHELKGMAYNFGLKQIGDLAKIGEDSAKDGDLETALSMVTTLKNSKDQNRTDLQNWVNK